MTLAVFTVTGAIGAMAARVGRADWLGWAGLNWAGLIVPSVDATHRDTPMIDALICI